VGIDDVGIDAAQTGEGASEVKTQVERLGHRAVVVDADVSKGADRERLLATVTEQLGPVDLLVNNAGVAPRQRLDILETSQESYDRLMGINLRGPFFLTQLVARQMVERRERGDHGRMAIVFISSVSAYASSPSRAEYCLSKAGVSMARALFADRLSGHDIGVYEIRPGIIETAMTAVVKDKYDKLIAEGLLPQKRWGTPQDVGKAVAAIAMGYLDYSTGQVIEVGGGFGLRRL
jgi:NAD(P)-dependent dehydrogenase (short-subunit alcohol dehydrogenase family)